MKKYINISTFLVLFLITVFSLVASSQAVEAANGNAYGLYGNPGNSLYGRSHNPNYSPYTWGGMRFATLEDLIDYMRLYYGNVSTGKSEVKATTKSATSIDTDEATLRGELKIGSSDYANVWFMYGTKPTYLVNTTATGYIDDDGTSKFSGTVTNLKNNTTYYFKAVGEDDEGNRSYGAVLSFRTGYNSNDNDDDDEDEDENYDVDIETNSVKNIEEDSAKITGEVDMNDLSNGVVFIVYGTDNDMIEDVEDDFDSFEDIDEDGDDLQKLKVDSDLDGSESYSETIDDLQDDTRYYVAYGVAYEDEDGDEAIELGNIRSFYTDDSNGNSSEDDEDEEPYVRTDGTDDIEEDTAKIYGYVDMNDFEDGTVFFVFGENRDELLNVQDDFDSYDDIDEDDDDIQKIKVYTNLDSKGTLEGELYGLDSDTTIYYIIGVEYEDEDGDTTLKLGAIRSFVTED